MKRWASSPRQSHWAAPGRPSDTRAERFPNRNIKMVVPFAAGGGVDVFARLLAERLKEQTGTNIIVENRGGANGTLGGMAVRQADPDGTTVLFSAATHLMAQM